MGQAITTVSLPELQLDIRTDALKTGRKKGCFVGRLMGWMGGMSLHCHLVFLEDAFSISTLTVRSGRMESGELFPYETCCQSQSSALQRRLLNACLVPDHAAPSSPAQPLLAVLRAQPSSKGFWTLWVWQDAGMTSIPSFPSCSVLCRKSREGDISKVFKCYYIPS